MAGKKQHFIPRHFLKPFLAPEAKESLWMLRRGNPSGFYRGQKLPDERRQPRIVTTVDTPPRKGYNFKPVVLMQLHAVDSTEFYLEHPWLGERVRLPFAEELALCKLLAYCGVFREGAPGSGVFYLA